MRQKIFQVDAFASRIFSGNPAAVCILDAWPRDGLMQLIALENNLSETAFAVKEKDHYVIRWFTPAVEVDLCGHATLATAHVLYHHLSHPSGPIRFHSPRSGDLTVERSGDLLFLDFPADKIREIPPPKALVTALNKEPLQAFRGKTDYLLVYSGQKEIEEIHPDFYALRSLGVRGIIITARGIENDFVSRFFAPGSGIDEDPVTGSAHTTLVPYWSRELQKKKMAARQISARGGELICEDLGERVKIGGKAVTYMIGEILIR